MQVGATGRGTRFGRIVDRAIGMAEPLRGPQGAVTALLIHCGRSAVMSDSATPWAVAHQAPLSRGFSRQEHWSGVPFPSPGDCPHAGIEPEPPALAGRFFTPEPVGKLNSNVK